MARGERVARCHACGRTMSVTAPGAPPAAAAPSSAAASQSDWSIDAPSVSMYARMFAEACAAAGGGVDRLGKAEAGAVLSMSGLPIEILLQIWSLADVGGDCDSREGAA